MDSKNRFAIVVAITVLIVLALFASFSRSLFFVHIPSITLSDLSDAGASAGEGSGEGDQYWKVDVTPETVQSIVETLSRPESYYRELTVETMWSSGSYSASVQYWEDGGWSHTVQTLASGAVRHDLTGPVTSYYWYDGSTAWNAVSSEDRSRDLAQRIPTYETVLELDTGSITAADYEDRGGFPCVQVEVQPAEGTLERYWISTDNGLLLSAEREVNGALVYRMTAYTPVQIPCPSGSSFALPDGQVLHTI